MTLKTNSLPPTLSNIILDKGTELPFTGRYTDLTAEGVYLCRQCGSPLFRSTDKFHSSCGWPSFDGMMPDAVVLAPDMDGYRTEILCAKCDAHLGHVFHGEHYTAKNTRHCVNSLSLDFITDPIVEKTEEVILAAGCFWGVEYCFKRLRGVVKTEVGYTGGHVPNPTYNGICSGNSGHFEAIRVLFDPQQVHYSDVLAYFFKMHNPVQTDGQGPDIGHQYLSAIFYYDEAQRKEAEKALIAAEKLSGHKISTQLLPVQIFWPAEEYHQDYYAKNGQAPYCHRLP